ncbi:hypothetical protein [Streptomyces sp. NPDC058623]|uniref:hypothetical protein n=1 Tax=Streptomyces sp. NPDC058623 TaxID=3346563 RepID=UPI003652A3AC
MNAEQVRHARAMLADPKAAVTSEPAMVVPDGRPAPRRASVQEEGRLTSGHIEFLLPAPAGMTLST